MTTDLLEAADLACRAFFNGSDRSRLNLQECMRDLRCCVNEAKKKAAQEDTTVIRKVEK